MEPEFDLQSYVDVLKRRIWSLIIPAIVIGVAAVGYAFVIPPAYDTSATILIESQQIPTDLASPTVTANAEERIHVIEQRLMARDNLLNIADKFKLYDTSSVQLSPTDIVLKMRDAIKINQIDASNAAARRGVGVIGFTVGFSYYQPTISARVTNELVSSILSQNIQSRLSRASETAKFFEQQKTDLEKKLLELENKIAEFKRTNESAIPETLQIRRDQLSKLTEQISVLDQRIKAATTPGLDPTLSSTDPTLQQLNFQLQAQQIQLESQYKNRDMLKPLAEKGYIAKNRMQDLNDKIALAELNIQALKSKIAAMGGTDNSDATIAALKSQRDALQKQASDVNATILRTPAVQVELNAMERNYSNLQGEYQQVQSKLQDALIGEQLEQDRQAERFEVLEQATVPDSPTSPNRPKIMMAGGIAGIAAGIGLIVLLEMLDKSIRTTSDLERRLQMRAIATIPYVETVGERRKKTWRTIIVIIAVVVAIGATLAAINYFYLPLDLVAERIMQRMQDWLVAIGLLH